MGLGSRNARRAGVVAVATSFVALISLALDIAGPVTQAQAQSASDARASFVEGNATTCGEVGFGADVQVGSSSDANASDANVVGTVKTNAGPTHTGEGEELDVGITGANVVVDAVVVKGGDAYNLYTNSSVLPPALPPDQHYIPPFNGGGNIGVISHWFVCYHLESPTTTTSTSTTTSSTTTSTSTTTTSTTTSSTTTSSTTTSTTIPPTTTSSSTTSTTVGGETTISLPSTTTTVPVTVSTEGSTSTTEPTTTTVASVTTEGPTVSTSPTTAGSSSTAAAATGTLPRTGGPSSTSIVVGGATLMLGLVLSALRPRRRHRS